MEPKALFSLQGNMIDRDAKQNGFGVSEGETMYSLTSTDRHAVCCLLNDHGGQSIQVEDGRVSPTLRAESHAHEPVVMCRAHGQANAETLEDCCPTLSCNHEQPIVFESHSQDARYTQQGDTSPACTAQWGTGGNNMPLVAFAQNQRDEVRDLHGVAGALAAEPGMKQQTYIAKVVAFSKEAYNTGKNARCSLGIESGDIAPTMRADTHPSGVAYKRLRWIVRRLTPTERERLQGFPDGWTDIGEWYDSTAGQGYWTDTKGKRHKTADSPRYKALGNSIALPQWWWITCKMARYLPEKATLGSLFDGIGGFPLVWESRHGKDTAVWASEIEEFPIAVTKMRFGEEHEDRAD